MRRLLPILIAALLVALTGCPMLPQAFGIPTPAPGPAMRLSDPAMIGAVASAPLEEPAGAAGTIAERSPWSLSGRVEWPANRDLQAVPSDVATRATVQLLDITLNRTVKTATSDEQGTFSLDIFTAPAAGHHYVLEAVKGLGNHAAGRDAVRLRLPLVFVAGQWLTPLKNQSGFNINLSTTALAIAMSHRAATAKPVTITDLIGSLEIGIPQDSPAPPTPDTYTPPATGGITVEEFHDLWSLASEAFKGDRDPVGTILMDTVTLGFRVVSEPHAVVTSTPETIEAGSVITISGRNFDTKNVAGNQVRIGTALAKTLTADRSTLTAEVPDDALAGYLSVQIGNLIALGPHLKVSPTVKSVTPLQAARAGETIAVSGTGFPPGTKLYMDALELPATITPTLIVAELPREAAGGRLVVQAPGTRVDAGEYAVLPTIEAIAPGSGATGTEVTVSGTALLSYKADTSRLTFDGQEATILAWSNFEIKARVPVEAMTGAVAITTKAGEHTGPTFTVAPLLQSVIPSAATTSSEITLEGTGFHTASESGQVSFNGAVSTSFLSWSNRTIKLKIPDQAQSGKVKVTTAATSSNEIDLTVLPSLGGLTPDKGKTGTTAKLTGTGFDPFKPGTSQVYFGGIAAAIKSWTPAAIEAVVPAKATSGDVTVKTSAPGTPSSAGKAFAVLPDLTGISPAAATTSSKVVLTGTGFDPFVPTGCKLWVRGPTGGLEAQILSWSPDKIEFKVPDGAITGDVTLRTAAPGQPTSNGLKLTVLPTLKAMTPTSAKTGTQVLLAGSGFGTLVAGTSKVTLGGTAAEIVSWEPTAVVFKVPAGAQSGDAVVHPAGVGASNGSAFTVLPTLASVTPDPQVTGQNVTLAGTGFDPFKAASSKVTIAGVDAPIVTWSATSVVIKVPDGAVTGDVVVKTSAAGSPASNAIKVKIRPTIAAVDKSPVRPGEVLKLTGTAFDSFLASTSKVGFGSATVTTGMTWTNTSISVVVPMDAISGNLTVTNRDALASAASTLTIAPLLQSLGVGSATTGKRIKLAGAAFGATRGKGVVKFGTVPAATYPKWTNREIEVDVPDDAVTGLVTVMDDAGEVSNGLSLSITPTITGVSPSSGVADDGSYTVTISGTGFHSFDAAKSKVYFSGTAATAYAAGGWTNRTIKAYVPADAQTGAVQVKTAHGDSNTSFSFTVKPLLSGITSKAAIGDSVTLTGTGFHGFKAGSSKITFTAESGTVDAATIASWANKAITATVPARAIAGPVTVTTAAGTSNSLSFGVLPTVSSLSVTSGIAGTTVTVSGTGFDKFAAASSKVKFNGTDAGVTTGNWGYSSITATVPSGASSGNVVVENAAGSSNGVAFTVLLPPSISRLDATSVYTGNTLKIYGSNLLSPRGGTTQVYFPGDGWVNVSSGTPTAVDVTVPGAAVSGTIQLKTLDGSTSYASLTILPQITSITSPAAIATSVTIQGSGFGSSRGGSYVDFYGARASTYTTWSQTRIVVTVPGGTRSGNVTVTVPGVGSAARSMAVKPVLSRVSPTSGRAGDRITVYGSGLDPSNSNSKVYFNGVEASSTDWRYYDRGFVYATVPSSATSGSVTLRNGAAQTSNGVNFTVIRGPSISSMSPTRGNDTSSFYVYLYGSNFGSSGGTVYIEGTFRRRYYRSRSYSYVTASFPLSGSYWRDNYIRVYKSGSYFRSGSYYYYYLPGRYYTVKVRDRYGNWSTGNRSLYLY